VARALLLGLVLLALMAVARADGISIRKVAVQAAEEGQVLTAELDIKLTPVLDDALHKGVPIYFVLEFDLIRPRWYWANEKLASIHQPQRLSYNTLTRQYRVGIGAYQNFATLQAALDTMSRVRRRLDIDGVLQKGSTYSAALRYRVDTTRLPKPFQLHTGRDWDMSSDWHRFTVQP
jgi:hypothetical protein